jgi:uncharacterized protein
MSMEAPPRISSLDALRGVGILGILAVHVQLFASPMAARANPTVHGGLNGANWWVWLATYMLADGKFISMFGMLFGAGIVVLVARPERSALPAGRLHYRRMAALLGFGLLHSYLLWYGDMLVSLAISGAAVFGFHALPPRRLIVTGVLVLAVAAAVSLAAGWSAPWWTAGTRAWVEQQWAPPAETIAREIALYRGGWFEQMEHRVPAAALLHSQLGVRVFWQMSGLMLLGMGLFKLGVFHASRPVALYAGMAAVGFGVGVSMIGYEVARNFRHGWDVWDFLRVGDQLHYWGNLLVGLAWIGVVMLLCRQGFRLTPFAAVGRTALSNYLLQTVLCTAIFYGHGLGLFARVDRVGRLAIVAGIWAVQLASSSLWLRYFSVGPAEWVWRSLTYGRWMPLLRRPVEG